MAPSATPLDLWLTDRTRYTTSTGRCRRQRYLTNHFGPTGYGIVRKAESLPLATGKYVHQALEYLCKAMQKDDALPSEVVIRQAITEACDAYHARVKQRGYAGLLQSERSDYIVVEQTCLLTGLVWAFAQLILPWLHAEYQIIEVEQESVYPLTDDIGIMLRQDVLAVPRNREGLAYFEFKTTGYAGDAWSEAWETKPQLSIGSFGVEERLGRKVTEAYIVGLYKGRRMSVGKGTEAWQRQESPFCYGYCKPGNPPLSTDDWKPSYEWIDTSTGEVKRASRAHIKQGVWTLPTSDWYHAIVNHNLPPAEWWAKQLPPDVLAKQVFLVGPLQRQEAQIQALRRQVVGEEQYWRTLLWDLFEHQRAGGWVWADDEFQAELDRLVPASWDCRRFGTRHQCEFVPICFKQPGWEDPLATGKFVPRRPHHQPELDVAIARGLLPAEAEEDEQDDHD